MYFVTVSSLIVRYSKRARVVQVGKSETVVQQRRVVLVSTRLRVLSRGIMGHDDRLSLPTRGSVSQRHACPSFFFRSVRGSVPGERVIAKQYDWKRDRTRYKSFDDFSLTLRGGRSANESLEQLNRRVFLESRIPGTRRDEQPENGMTRTNNFCCSDSNIRFECPLTARL